MANEESLRVKHACGTALVSVFGDITEERVEAIVNAANTRLMHGGGVAGAIARKGGPTIQAESNRIAPVQTGSAGITPAGDLPCKWVIHAVGPVWGGGSRGESELLRASVRAVLALAVNQRINSLSFPAISAGIFGFPAPKAAATIVSTVCEFLDSHPGMPLTEIRFCNIGRGMVQLFDAELRKIP